MAYSDTVKEEARFSETPTRRTKLHGVTHQNTVTFTLRNALQAVRVNAGWNPQWTKTMGKRVCMKEDIYIILLPHIEVSLAGD
jgi:hypothetical protein